MKILRLISAVLLSLVLGLAPVSAGFSRGPVGPVLTLTICTGDGTKTISLDQDGLPINARHVCLDCCLVVNQLPENTALAIISRLGRRISVGIFADTAVVFQHSVKPDARAPPALH